jgi:hypothetical protein
MKAVIGRPDAMGHAGATTIHPVDLRRARALFEACSATAAPQTDLLDRECGGDHELRALVESMLAAEAGEHPVLDRPLCLAASEPDGFTLQPGARTGDWEVIREIASGGMGAVYLAKNFRATGDELYALKIVRWPSRDFARRFDREQAILRGIDHPNIARFVDGGVADENCPYLVMEYVDGQPIDRYALAHRLRVEQLIELFRDVCGAVAYLHRNLIVHRDLKPGNILITPAGGVKLVDFGIAKLLDSPDPSGNNSQTLTGLMTPDYASPEQIRGKATSTLTDVYSLGVLLYELLSGRRPFADPAVAMHEILRRICEAEPDKPSAVAARRPEYVNRMRKLRGELDNIVLKAMRAAPEQRYRTVEELDEDLRRHLTGLPVIAQADSVLYRTHKFVARHMAGVSAAAAIVVLLAGGIVATTIEAGIARKALKQAEVQAENAEAARAIALAEERGEEEQRRRAENAALMAQEERANAERRLQQLQSLARGAIEIYRSQGDQALPPQTAALIAGQARNSLKSLGAEGLLTPELASLYAGMQINADKKWSVPEGWSAAESAPDQYRVGIDRNFAHGGRQSLFIRSGARAPAGIAVVYQTFAAVPYRGKRVRLSAFLASTEISAGAVMTIRTFGPNDAGPEAVSGLFGANGWTNRELVIDVPAEAGTIQFGIRLQGAGTVWADDFRFEEVSAAVPLSVPEHRDRPMNLDFRAK